MALFIMILRKMLKNKWLEISLLFGLILTVALVSSMPIYTEAILQRMLVKDLENLQTTTQTYPGSYLSAAYVNDDMENAKVTPYIQKIDQFMKKEAKPGFALPVQYYVQARGTVKLNFAPLHPDLVNPKVKRFADIMAMSELEKNIKLVDGRLPAKEPVNGVYEVLVTDSALTKLKMVLGNEFVLKDDDAYKEIIIKPVGVFDKKDKDSVYWMFKNISSYKDTFFMPFELFEKDFTSYKTAKLRSAYWYFALDYSNMSLQNVYDYVQTHQRIEKFVFHRFENYGIQPNALETIHQYFEREQQLKTMLWSLYVPVLMMLAFYLFMVANLIMSRQKTEIAVLRSRGASRLQILTAYIVEGVILGSIAFVIGPQLGVLFTKVLGASNGFLEFVHRSALHAKADGDAYKYALYAVLCSLVMTLIPAFLATKATIVSHKQQMARKEGRSFWHRFFLDFILIGVAVYGLKSFHRRMQDLLSLGADSVTFKIDPLLFFIPALFMLGFGLFVLRVYPWFIRLIYGMGRKWWPPSLYSTLIQVGRSSTQYQFLMIFLILTISTGLYSASAARTMNQNAEDQIHYKNGADLTLKVQWENDKPPEGLPGLSGQEDASSQDNQEEEDAFTKPKRVQYTEPPFKPFLNLPGVQNVAKVFIKENADVSKETTNASVTLMGIDTDDFGRTAWYRAGLLEHDLNAYLNLIAGEPTAVLLSKSLATEKGIKVGDSIYLGWTGVEPKLVVVYGIVDYFPAFNPNPKDAKEPLPRLVVAHLDFIQNNLALEPYEVWLKLVPGAHRQELFDALRARKIPILEYRDTTQELIVVRNDAFHLAMNGAMTLGFLISILISFIGFLLYWILSLSGRILQLGIFRALGISFMQLVWMLITEQLLTSGAAILIGILTGNVTSRLFVPLFQMTFNPTTQVPPFQVTFHPQDALGLYIIVTVMISLALIILSTLLSRIKIHQAVKLGED